MTNTQCQFLVAAIMVNSPHEFYVFIGWVVLINGALMGIFRKCALIYQEKQNES